ncbi:unnamed protein product [Urochloa humidicola]
MTPWDPAELPHGGTGISWYFTELQRNGDNVSRKTENGQSWSGKSGRLPKKGYPDDILVAKLVLNKEFHMLELTLKEHKQPTVALCKIWRKSNSTSQTPSPSIVFSPGASTSQPQVLEDHFNIPGGATGMQIDQPQGLFQEPTVQDDQSTNQQELLNCMQRIQDAFSLLQDTRGLFSQIALFHGDLAHKIASEAENLASYYRNEVISLEISGGTKSNWPSTSMSTQVTGAVAVSGAGANSAVLAPEPETAIQDDGPYQEPNEDFMEGSFFDVGSYLATPSPNYNPF